MKKLFVQFIKKTTALLISFSLIFTPLSHTFRFPLQPKQVLAEGGQCSADSSGAGGYLSARVGGVSLDQAATFLADMSDITGAYYDSDQDRIVFVGQKNTALPKFDKDDLAVAIKAVIFNQTIPWVSIERKNPSDSAYNTKQDVLYGGGIENTNFGKILLDADWDMKMYVRGFDQNDQQLSSNVSGYKPVYQRWIDKNPSPTLGGGNMRYWILPKEMLLKKDDATTSFVFDHATMKVMTEPLSTTNDPLYNEAAQEFAQHHTDNFDLFATERPSYEKARQLGKVVSVVKWLKDNNISSDFHWAKEYAPIYNDTPEEMPLKIINWAYNGWTGTNTGGVEYTTGNTYQTDNGTSSTLKNASEAVSTSKEDVHWTFSIGGQNYESVAVAADAFRSLGGYSTASTDFAFPTRGDNALTFSRSYSSFSGGQNGIGRGWDFMPSRFRVSTDYDYTNCPIGGTTIKFPNKVSFTSKHGYESSTLQSDCTQGWKEDDPAYYSDGTLDVDGPTGKINFVKVTTKDQDLYTFDGAFRLTSLTDENNNSLNYAYDANGKLTTIADSAGHQLTLSYNPQSLISSISDWTGRTVQYGYDAQGNLTTVTDPRGNVTTYVYDANNKLISIKNRLDQTVVENTYTPEAKVATQKDAAGRIVTFDYNEQSKLVTITDNLGRTTKATYDDKARILADTDALNKSIIYTYGVEFAPLTVTDKNNNKTTNTYDVNGNLTSTTFPDTKQITYVYDSKNRLTSISDGRYGATPKVTTFIYDPKGNLLQTNEANILTNFTYDSFGGLLSSKNHLNKTTNFTRDAFGNPLTVVDPLNNTTINEYDLVGRMTKKTDPEGKIASFVYDPNNNITSETNAAGSTAYVYDAENHLKKTTLPNTAATEFSYNPAGSLTTVKDALTSLTSYGYDSYQNLISQQDALNHQTNYLYDQLNRQTQSTTPLGKVAKWEYDPNGNLTKRIDAANQATTYVYDILNRLKTITYPDTKTINFTYDDRGNLTQMVDPIGTTNYTYDTFDRLTQVANPYAQNVSYLYDELGNLKTITYPDTKTVQYTYDENNRLKTTTDWNNQQTNYTYKGNGLLASKTLPNGIASSYSYDNANRLASIEHLKGTTQLAKYSYQRDAVGNIKQVSEEGNSIPQPTPTPSATPTPTPTSSPTPIPTATPTPTPTPTPVPTVTPTPTPTGSPKPDLIPIEITISNPAPKTNDYFNITTKVKNQGPVETYWATTVYVGFYYDRSTPPNLTDSYNAQGYITGGVSPGQEVSVTKASARFSTAGSHNVWVIADRTNKIAESDETNNVFGPFTFNVTTAMVQPQKQFADWSLDAVFSQLFSRFILSSAYAQTAPSITTFTYDLLSRITGVVYPGNTNYSFTYDKTDNRLTQTIDTMTTNYNHNTDSQLITAGPTNFTHNPNGNVSTVSLGLESKTLGYDFDNRLVNHAVTVVQPEATYALKTANFSGIDIGSNSAPAFVDIDNDSDQDMFIGESSGTVKYYKNTGTASTASYVVDTSLTSGIDVGNRSTPTFTDIDNDGDQDFFIGRSIGETNLYRNTGTASVPAFTFETDVFAGIDVGSYNTPVFVDIDNDGDKDFVSGKSTGVISYYKNTGTPTSFSFTEDTALFAGIDIGSNSVPTFVDFDKDGDHDLFIGNSNGALSFYRNTGSKTSPAFTLVTANFNSIAVGTYSIPNFVDINGDTFSDLFIGEYDGVINQYSAAPVFNTATTNFTYDGAGNRLQKSTTASTTRYVNDVNGDLTNVLAETNTSNSIQNYYAYGLGVISQGTAPSANRTYPLTDGMGNIRLLTNSSGAIVNTYNYDPYGNIRSNTGTAANNYKFSSEQLDSESGLYFLRARYYDPTTGRFISKDPLRGNPANPATLNPYIYGYNNPIRFSDPSGKCGIDETIAIGMLGITAACKDGDCTNEMQAGMRLWPGPGSGGQIINGIQYVEHALMRMMPRGMMFEETLQGTTKQATRGVPPSVVENTIQFGEKTVESGGKILHEFENVGVVTNDLMNRVITVFTSGH